MNTDLTLSVDDLVEEGLPRDVKAYWFYPAGVHIPVMDNEFEVGSMIVTEDFEDPSCVEFGCYSGHMEVGFMAPVHRDRLATVVTYLLDPPEGVDWYAWAAQRFDDDPEFFEGGSDG